MKIFLKSAALAALLLIISLTPVITAVSSDDYLILVNENNPLPDDFLPRELIEVSHTRNDGRPKQKMCKPAANALDALLSELLLNFPQNPVSVTSGFRSREYQKFLFEYSMREYISRGMNADEAYNAAKRFTAPPGASEHETGLAADIHNLSCASCSFADTEEFRWLCENAYRFGFILRYPKDKESVTGIGFEPWHWRYVGKFPAEEMRAQNLCLEEYLKYIKN